MEWSDVEARIEAGDNPYTEFKRMLEFRQVGRAICGFANTDGGVLVLGVDDGGAFVGIAGDAQSVEERLTNHLQNGCSAPVRANIGRHPYGSAQVYWVDVPRQRGFEPLRQDGRVWVRRERSTVEPSPMELQELYNAFGFVLTEEQTIPPANPSDIDLQVFRTYLARQGFEVVQGPQPAVEDDLRNRGIFGRFRRIAASDPLRPARVRQPTPKRPPNRQLLDRVHRLRGNDQGAEGILVIEAKGRLDEQVDRALGWARGLGRFENHDDVRRKDTPLPPLAAVREAIVNAVVHRDYAITGSKVLFEVFYDRVEITSPGALPNHMTVAAVRTGGRTRSRNEQIANYMLNRQYMEKPGRGWLVRRNAMAESNGTEPEIEHDEDSRFVTVRFRLPPHGRRDLPSRQ